MSLLKTPQCLIKTLSCIALHRETFLGIVSPYSQHVTVPKVRCMSNGFSFFYLVGHASLRFYVQACIMFPAWRHRSLILLICFVCCHFLPSLFDDVFTCEELESIKKAQKLGYILSM